jgi:CheY-like chemotaxis protein
MMETPTMSNERLHPSAFAPERFPPPERIAAEDALSEAPARTVRIDGRLVGYRIAPPKMTRVLVVDDDHDNANSLSMLIRLWGHQVWTAYSGPAGLAAAAVHRPDVMLLDIGMPVMSGCEVARQLRRQTAFEDALLVAVTGYADIERRLLCEVAGFDAVLVKPVELSVLQTWLVRSKIDAPLDFVH